MQIVSDVLSYYAIFFPRVVLLSQSLGPWTNLSSSAKTDTCVFEKLQTEVLKAEAEGVAEVFI